MTRRTRGRASRAADGLAVAVLLSLGCAPARQEIVFWQFFPAEVIEPVLARFERAHPGLEVRMERLAWNGGLEKITAAVAARTVPDLCEVGSTWMPQMLASGQLADWSAGTADLRPSLRGWQLCAVGDAVYGLPWLIGTDRKSVV